MFDLLEFQLPFVVNSNEWEEKNILTREDKKRLISLLLKLKSGDKLRIIKEAEKIVLIEITWMHWSCILIMKRDYWTRYIVWWWCNWITPVENLMIIYRRIICVEAFRRVVDVLICLERFDLEDFNTVFFWFLFLTSFQKLIWLSQLSSWWSSNNRHGNYSNQIKTQPPIDRQFRNLHTGNGIEYD